MKKQELEVALKDNAQGGQKNHADLSYVKEQMSSGVKFIDVNVSQIEEVKEVKDKTGIEFDVMLVRGSDGNFAIKVTCLNNVIFDKGRKKSCGNSVGYSKEGIYRMLEMVTDYFKDASLLDREKDFAQFYITMCQVFPYFNAHELRVLLYRMLSQLDPCNGITLDDLMVVVRGYNIQRESIIMNSITRCANQGKSSMVAHGIVIQQRHQLKKLIEELLQ